MLEENSLSKDRLSYLVFIYIYIYILYIYVLHGFRLTDGDHACKRCDTRCVCKIACSTMPSRQDCAPCNAHKDHQQHFLNLSLKRAGHARKLCTQIRFEHERLAESSHGLRHRHPGINDMFRRHLRSSLVYLPPNAPSRSWLNKFAHPHRSLYTGKASNKLGALRIPIKSSNGRGIFRSC